MMPCVVSCVGINRQIEQRSFENYTNHDKGDSGLFIASCIAGGATELTILFDDGDQIEFYPWTYFEKRQIAENPLLEIANLKK
jgi:DUF971 family protein